MDCRSIFQSLSQTLHNPPRVRCVPLLLKIINPGRSIPSKTLAKLPSFLYGNPGLPAFGKRSPFLFPFQFRPLPEKGKVPVKDAASCLMASYYSGW
ncbi:hypothetical protein CEXT_18761 [Caerostris extrusa]|uniref:Uncharacterized protein n=1 Tax=Caerostris extrusa TaxID=172846 RepID=A0AAV4SIZ5_CAEEX|nr:hypothetical protein CEXT_18761 [Caerostris extrusa]